MFTQLKDKKLIFELTKEIKEEEEKRRKLKEEEKKLKIIKKNEHLQSLILFKNKSENFIFNKTIISSGCSICWYKTKQKKYNLDFSPLYFKEILIFDLIVGKTIQYLCGNSYEILNIKYYNDKNNQRQILINVSRDKYLKLWNINDNYSNILIIPSINQGWTTSLYLVFSVHCN